MKHKHKREEWWPDHIPKCIELSDTVCIQKLGRYGKPDDYISGFIIAHDVEGEEFRCEGAINTDPELTKDGKFWVMTGTLEDGDLTLSPSILCTTHPEFHAFLTNGKWR